MATVTVFLVGGGTPPSPFNIQATYDDRNGKIANFHAENNDAGPHKIWVDWNGQPINLQGQPITDGSPTVILLPGEVRDFVPPPTVRWDQDPFAIRAD